ncbi:MAG: hypothetical protein ACLFWL_18250 [Candidatus Brocadiia bacterium]
MSTDGALAQAASRLTVPDYEWLRDHGVLSGSAAQDVTLSREGAREHSEHGQSECVSVTQSDDSPAGCVNDTHSQEANTQEEASQEDSSQEETGTRKRRKIDHEWPEVGTILEAHYQGVHYEAEVVSRPRYKSGKAIRILSGPAIGEVERSMSGAMLKATEKHREEEGLGRKGVSNGWDFWKVKEESDAKES